MAEPELRTLERRGSPAAAGLAAVFLAGAAVGAAGWVPKLDAWAHYAIDVSLSLPWRRFLLPVFLEDVQSTVFRPFQNLFLAALYNAVGLSPTPYYLAKAALHGLFGAAVFLFFSALSGSRRTGAASALLSVLSAPVVYSSWNISEFGHVSAGFMFLALWTFLRGGGLRRTLPPFLGFAALTVATKETEAVLLPAFLTLFIGVKWMEGERPGRRDWVFLAAAGAVTLACYAAIGKPGYEAPKHAATAGYAAFLLNHNLSQMFYLLYCGGTAALFAGGAARALGRLGAPPAAAAWSGIALLAAGFTFPVTPIFSFYEAVFFPQSVHLRVFQAALAAGLVLWAAFGSGSRRFAAAAALTVFTLMYLLPLFVPFVRADIGSRHYIAALPFLLYLAAEGAREMARGGLPGRAAAWACLAALALDLAVGAYDMKVSNLARSRMEQAADRILREDPLDDAVVLFTNPVWRLSSSEIKLIRPGAKTQPGAVFVNAANPDDSAVAVLQELTLKSGDSPRAALVDVQAVEESPPAACAKLEGDFRWTETPDSFFGLTDIHEGLFQDLAEKIERSGSYNFIQLDRKRACSKADFFWKAVADRVRVLKEERAAFVQFPRMIEDLPARVLGGVPIALKSAWLMRYGEPDLEALRRDWPDLKGRNLPSARDLRKRYKTQIACNEVAAKARELKEAGDLDGASALLMEGAERCEGGVYDEMLCEAVIDGAKELVEAGKAAEAAELLKTGLAKCGGAGKFEDALCGAVLEKSRLLLKEGAIDEALAAIASEPKCQGVGEESVCGAVLKESQKLLAGGKAPEAMALMAKNPHCEEVGTFRQSWCELRQSFLWKALEEKNLDAARKHLEEIEAGCEGSRSWADILKNGARALAKAADGAGRPDLAVLSLENLVRRGDATILDFFNLGERYLAAPKGSMDPAALRRFIGEAEKRFSDDAELMDIVKRLQAR